MLLHGRTWSSLPDFDLKVRGEDLSLMDALVAKGFAVYALDLPGYGKSPRLPSGWLSPNQASDALAAALIWIAGHDGLPGKPAVLGYSNGSAVSSLLAQRHPELISDLILFGYSGYPHSQAQPTADPPAPPRIQNTDQAARSDFRTPGTISQAAMDAYAKACLAADPVRADWDHLEQWNALDPAKVKTPVLLIEGQFDPYAPLAAQGRAFVRFSNPDREWVILAGGDHASLIEKMQPAFVAAIVNFLGRPHVLP